MRVTANTFPNSLVDQLNRLATRQNRLQSQAATGQRLTLPDDDPVAMRRVLDMQTETNTVSQYQRNIDRDTELATSSFSSMKSLKKVTDRASEIATLADGLKSPEELRAYAAEVDQLIEQGVHLVNVQNRGDYIFSGTKADQVPFVATKDANGKITGVSYQGNTSLAENEIGFSVTMSAQTLGANTTGTGERGLVTDSRVGADLFNHLVSLRDNLLGGNTAAISATNASQLEADADNLVYHLGTNGAVQSRLEVTKATLGQRNLSLETMVSKEADADLSQTLVRLNQVQTSYQAALQSAGSILNRSLMDYLR